jgi:creatinine amidohydrolase
MPVHELAQLTWEEARDLDRAQTIVVLPVGAIEAHGPHLPLDTDVVIATAMARAGARKLAAGRRRGGGERTVLILPALAYTAASFGAAFHGTLSISGITVTALIVDIARSLSDQGFRLLALANVHLDPEHLTALNEAVKLGRADNLLPIIFPDLTRKPWGSRLGDEFRSGACHAGQFETSIVLRERADAVRDEVRQSLAPNPQSLSKAIKAGKRTFAEAGGARAYFGDPAAATADEGARLVEALGSILEEAVLAEV